MKHTGLVSRIVIVGLAAATVVPFLVRGGLRSCALQKVFEIPEARRRLGVMPTERTIVPPPPTAVVNLGFATFDTGSTGAVTVEARGSRGTVISATNRDFEILFMAPFSLGQPGSSGIDSSTRTQYPQTAARLDQLLLDPISAQIDIERSAVLPFHKVALLSKGGFIDYALRLGEKASLNVGCSEVFYFTTAFTRGLVRIGETQADRSRAAVMLVDLHDDLHLGFRAHAAGAETADIAQILDPILGSFRFTMSVPAAPEAVRQRISAAGISTAPHGQR